MYNVDKAIYDSLFRYEVIVAYVLKFLYHINSFSLAWCYEVKYFLVN